MTLPPTTACLQKRLQKAVHQEDVSLEGGQQVPGYFLLIVLEQKVNPLGSLEYVQAGFWTTDEPHQWGQGSDASQQLWFCAVESSLAAPEMAEVEQRHRLRSPCPPTKPSQLVIETFLPPIKTTDHPPGGACSTLRSRK